MIGMSTLPAFLRRAVAATPAANRKKLVVLFQRGAADGLNIVVPFAEPNYYRIRPTHRDSAAARRAGKARRSTSTASSACTRASRRCLPLFQKQQLAIVHAAGSPDTTRSHFDAQDYMESGTPGVKATDDGWLNRALQRSPEAGRLAVPRRGHGREPAAHAARRGARDCACRTSSSFASSRSRRRSKAASRRSTRRRVDQALRGTGTETFEAIDMLRKADPSRFQPENGAMYPNGRVGQTMQQVAQLHKADIGLEVTFVDTGGWDNHVNEGGAQGQLSNLLRDLGQSMAAFSQDMGDRMEDIVVVTMSEFGRTAHENGNRGTDHGHANCMFVMGGEVKGGKVYGKWPGLGPEQLNEGRDLTLTTDFRSVLGEVISGHLGTQTWTRFSRASRTIRESSRAD